ncbi:MAG TPA: hypothetical protein VN694_05110 [Caulobacteraceae bacterium]|nr:hypothetical protein [Caulobacteraceae bacterium]
MMLLIAIAAAALLDDAGAARLTTAAPPPITPQAAGPLSFDGAHLGMTIGEWRALAPPPGVGPTAAADCGPGILAALREARVTTAAQGTGQTVCAYDARFGDDVLLHSAKLDDRYRIDALRYRFIGGRLSEVDFTASVDAYNDIVAKLTHDYGRPTSTVRGFTRTSDGRFAEVRQTWRADGGVVTLTDPTYNPLRLSVRIAEGVQP